jgi:putative membrane protein
VILGHRWTFAPVPILALAVGLALFVHGFVRLRSRGRPDRAPWTRAALFAAALAAALVALVSPLDEIAEDDLLSAHMLQHVLIGDLAPALAILAVRGPLLFLMFPPAVLAPLARARWLRRALGALLRPKVSFAVWATALLAWHVPRAYDFALAHRWAHDLQHASFVLGGLLAWTQLVDPARRRELSVGGRVAFAVGMFAVGQVIGDALLYSSSAHYAPYADAPSHLLGLSALSDQRLAGIVMMVEQVATLGTCVGVLLWPYITRRRPVLELD